MADFFDRGSAKDFEDVLKLYSKAVKAKADEKKKKKGESLQSLDKWMQEELQSTAAARTPPHITRAELVRLVEWKLSRGKFRPRLVEFAGSNEEEKVIKVTGNGIKLGSKGKVEEAIAEIATLKGIGPATASAVLAICCPKFFCFFADEVAKTALSLPNLKYTAQEYVALNSAVMECAARLNKELDGEEEEWTPHRVELTIWTYCVLEKNEPALLPSISSSSSSPPPAKKRRS